MRHGTYTYGQTPPDVIREALGEERYPMTLRGEDEIAAVVEAVNQGIDRHLEAVTDSSFEWDSRGGLVCDVAPDDMFVLLRRLGEAESEEAMSLRSSILFTLDIEEV